MSKTDVSNNLKRLARRLFESEQRQSEFIDGLLSPAEYPVAIVWTRERPELFFETLPRPDWFPDYVDLVSFDQRPGQHELHDAGYYYCLDPSSVFMMLGLTRHIIDVREEIDSVLDACASPGGKTVMTWRALKPDHLYSNEVIGKRIGPLVSNLKRCKVTNANVTSVDTSRFVESAQSLFDLVLVDAPCSGQSLIAKGKTSPGCFHPATINMNANRQRRILSNSAAAVRPGGWLIYMTCTYSLKENENNVDWFLKRNANFDPIEIESLKSFKSERGKSPAYRLWPSSQVGAGGFFAVLKKSDDAEIGRAGHFQDLRVRWTSETD